MYAMLFLLTFMFCGLLLLNFCFSLTVPSWFRIVKLEPLSNTKIPLAFENMAVILVSNVYKHLPTFS
jgi:hypothetical protein